MLSLSELGEQYDTDKVDHEYLPHYSLRFAGQRDKPITLLEIGVMKGQSLRMWRDYFPDGNIYGIDAVEESIFEEERIYCFRGLQEDAAFLERVIEVTGSLDFLVDDGGHKGTQHVASFDVLWKHIKPGGWYCIEDCFSIFNICWTQPGDRTMLDVLNERWRDIFIGASDISEVTVISDGINDGLIFLHKREAKT